MNNRVLVVDDEETIRKLLKARLEREGYKVDLATQGDEALDVLKKAEYGCVVTDIRMPGVDGLELTRRIRKEYPTTQVVVVTGHGEKEVAVEALRAGAANYLEKPFDLDELSLSVKRCFGEFALQKENSDLVARLEARVERVEAKVNQATWFASKAASMNKVNEWLSVLKRESTRTGADEPSVLIQGESGTGKEGIARQVHEGSRRSRGPWVAVNCANFTEQLLESELFGHERGAFTGAQTLKRGLFEIAKGGTLFLDELGEMDVKLQAKLLRVLQEKVFRRVGGTVDLETDVRVVAATNRDLMSRVKGGQFREDLYHRLSQVVMELPPLRERREDIVEMAKQFGARAFQSRGKVFGGFSDDATRALKVYAWPGNVRELLNVVERAALVAQGTRELEASDLNLPVSISAKAGTQAGGFVETPVEVGPASDGMEGSFTAMKKRWSDAFEREYLIAALRRHDGNVSAAAREAQIDRSNFLRLLRRHQIHSDSYRKAA